MDKKVIDAMARWPNVPAVFGWLSLNERGQWRLHPAGDALADAAAPDPYAAQGTSISSPQILQFMNRNYGCDDIGRWFFQNGPQKVYVRLDAAPYILHTGNALNGMPSLHAHTGQQIRRVVSWWLTEHGRLYALTDLGPGLVAGRDLDEIIGTLRTLDDQEVVDLLQAYDVHTPAIQVNGIASAASSLSFCKEADIPSTLGFVRLPRAEG